MEILHAQKKSVKYSLRTSGFGSVSLENRKKEQLRPILVA